MATHLQHKDRQRQNHTDPEPARHVDKLVARARVRSHHQRFERHAADRAASGPVLTNLGMHRAGPDRAFDGLWRCGLLGQVACGIGLELRLAACRAEIVSDAVRDQRVLGRGRIDIHAADRVGYRGSMRRMMVPGVLMIVCSVFRHSSDPW